MGLGIVLGSKPSLLHHHFSLCLKILFPQDQVLHSIRFEIQGDLDPVRAEILKVASKIMRGEGIGSSSVLLDDPGEFLGTDFLGSLEHHVFEQMGEPRFPIFLVPRPNPVPDLERDDWGFVVFEENDFEAVRQDPLENLVPEPGLGKGGQGNVPEKAEPNGFPSNHLSPMSFASHSIPQPSF